MNNQTLRIIAGKWRSRKIHFPAIKGLRPTGDRVRETVFNWLAADVLNARVLDLFAGSGVFGFEALSRGAKEAVFVDRSIEVTEQLKATALELNAGAASIHQCDALDLPKQLTPFDLVFLDPPFDSDLLKLACQSLLDQSLLAENAVLYIETKKSYDLDQLPGNLRCIKEKTTGDVRFGLHQLVM